MQITLREHPGLMLLLRAALAVILLGLVADVLSADVAATYKAKCTMCHGASGAGDTPAGKAMKARDLRSPEVKKQTDDQLAAVIANGRNKMPKFAGKLSAAEIKALVQFIRALK